MKKVLHSVAQALVATAVAPEWLHLIPAGLFKGADGRGPFEVKDPVSLIAASMHGGRKLPIDENHAIDRIGTLGQSSPARAWIVELESRADGIWGRVEWTGEGKRIMEDRAYGFISPALLTTKAKPHIVSQLLRASLVNDPNLTDLKSLHQPEETDMEEELRQALGLPETADKDAILAAVATLHSASTSQAALMSRLAEAAGAKKDATADELVVAINSRGKGENADTAALQQQVTSLNSQLTQLTTNTATIDSFSEIASSLSTTAFASPASLARRAASALRAAVIADINEAIGRLPAVMSIETSRPADAFQVANHIYGDELAVLEAGYLSIVGRNRHRHPAALPAGRIEALR